MKPLPITPGQRRREGGYSLVELLIASLIMLEVLYGVMILFDSSSEFARVQSGMAIMQQAQRVSQNELVRVGRMAGIGGMAVTVTQDRSSGAPVPVDGTAGLIPDGLALEVRNNVPPATESHAGSGDLLVPGSDMLVLRGVFSTPLFVLADGPQQAVDISGWYAAVGDGTFTLQSQTLQIPSMGRGAIPQPLGRLKELIDAALAAGRREAFIIRDTLNPLKVYGVLELEPAGTDTTLTPCGVDVDGDPIECITLGLTLTDGNRFAEYGALTRGSELLPTAGGRPVRLPDTTVVTYPERIGSIGLLEEYRYYLRADSVVTPTADGSGVTQLTPVLVRGRYLPNTDIEVANQSGVVAENVYDLQVAIGFDTDRDGVVTDNGDDTDEILFNSADDVEGDGTVKPPPGLPGWTDARARLHFLRVNTLVFVDTFDRGHEARTVALIEDFDRSDSALFGTYPDYNDAPYVGFRRRLLQTIVETRNL